MCTSERMVCMHALVCVRVPVYVHVCTHVCACVLVCVHTRTRMCACVCPCVCTCTRVCVHAHTHMCACVYSYVCLCFSRREQAVSSSTLRVAHHNHRLQCVFVSLPLLGTSLAPFCSLTLSSLFSSSLPSLPLSSSLPLQWFIFIVHWTWSHLGDTALSTSVRNLMERSN